MMAPCKDCPDRAPVCHDSCERYQAYRAERDRISEARQREIVRYKDNTRWHPRRIRGDQ